MYRITKLGTKTPDSKTNINVSNFTSVESSNSVRRPKSKDTKSNNRVLKNTNDKSPSAYVQKMSSSVSIGSNKCETMNSTIRQTNKSVLNTKNVTAVNDGSNIVCVSCAAKSKNLEATSVVDCSILILLMFRDTLYFPVETLENPFVAPVNIQTIKSFMHRIGYQGMVDKVSAFYMKNLAQPWQTMFKVFNRYLTTRTSGHDQTKINILQLFHAMINRINVDYVALLWIEEDYHSIKDDIPLVSLYTIRNVLVRGMLIQDEFLTKEISVVDDFKKYKTVFMNVDVLMNQSQPVVSTQGTHMITPRAYRTPILTTASPQEKKRKQSVGETSSLKKSLKITIRQKQVDEGEKYNQSYDDVDDSDDRLEPESHKKNPEHVDDDDDKDKVDEKKDDEMGSLKTRTEEIQTLIPTPTRSPRTILSSDKNITQELTDTVSLPTATTSKDPHSKRRISSKYSHILGALRRMCKRQSTKDHRRTFQELQNNVIQVHPTTTTSTETTSSADLQQQLYLKMKISLQDQANDPALWEHINHQEDDAPPEGGKRVKKHKASKSSKSVRGSSSKRSAKDYTTYVSKQQQKQQEWDAWVEETVIDKDEVIPKDETPKLITELLNVDKHVPTIFDHARMKATLNDMLSNQFKNAEEYTYHLEQITKFMENQIV
ncbi:hypothetical protein Tco_1291589 [Tanacetum coccineum]